MPSPQLMPFNAQEGIPANAKGIELCLRVNSKNEITTNDGTIYNLKEVNILYEKASPGRYTNSFISKPQIRLLEQPTNTRIGLDGSPSSPRVLPSAERSPTRGMLSKSPKQFSLSRSMDTSKELLSVPPSKESSQSRSHIFDTLETSDLSVTGKPLINRERLLKDLESLILFTRTCRDNLAQSIDSTTREMLESKYFEATQELAKLETKLNELGYGGYVATLKNKSSQRRNFSIDRSQHNLSIIPKDDFSRSNKLPSNHTEQPKQSTAKFRGYSSVWLDKPKQDFVSQHLKNQTQKSFIRGNNYSHELHKNITIPHSSRPKGSSIFKPSKEFEETEYGLGYTGNDNRKSYSHSSFGRAQGREKLRMEDSYTRRKAVSSVQGDEFTTIGSLLDTKRATRDNLSGGDLRGLKNSKRNQLEQVSPSNEHHLKSRERMGEEIRFENRLPTIQLTDSEKPDMLSKVMDLRKQYKKLRMMKLEARRKLIDEINSRYERERIEGEYFKVQTKMEEIQQKLKHIALKAGMDHKRLLEIALVDKSDSQSEISSTSEDSRFDSRLALQNSNLFSSQESTQSTQEEINGDFDTADRYSSIRRSESLHQGKHTQGYFRRSLNNDDMQGNINMKYRFENQNGNLPRRGRSAPRKHSDILSASKIKESEEKLSLVNRGVQTEDMIVNSSFENNEINKNTKEDERPRSKLSKPRYDVLDGEKGSEYEYEPLANATENISEDHLTNSDSDDMDMLRKKRLAYFKTHSPNDRPQKIEENFIEASEITNIHSAPEMSFDDFDEKFGGEDVASSEASKHYEGSSELSSSITPRLLLPPLPPSPLERGMSKQRSHIVERIEDIRSRLISKPVLFDVSDFSSQGSRDDVEVIDAGARGFFDGESDNGDDRKYKLYDVSDVETGMMNGNKQEIEAESRYDHVDISSSKSRITDQDLVESENRSQDLLKSMITDLEKLDMMEHEPESYDSILNHDYDKLFEISEEALADKEGETDNKTRIILDEGKTVQDNYKISGFEQTEVSREGTDTNAISAVDLTNAETEILEVSSANDRKKSDLEKRKEDEESSQGKLTSYHEKIEAIKARLLQSKQNVDCEVNKDLESCEQDSSVSGQSCPLGRDIGEEQDAYESDDKSHAPDTILPRLEDSLRSSLVIDNVSHDYLSSILDDEEIVLGQEDLELPQLPGNQTPIEEEFEFEEIPTVESLPPESGLDVSLRQSLELLDRLEQLESDSGPTSQNFDRLEGREIVSGSSEYVADFNGNVLKLDENQNIPLDLVKQEQMSTTNFESPEITSTKDIDFPSMKRNIDNDADLLHEEDIPPLPPSTMPPVDSPKDLEEWNDSDSEMSGSSANSVLRSPFGTKSMPVQTSAKFAEDDSFHGEDRTIENRIIESEVCFESFSPVDVKDFDEVLAVLDTVPVDGFTLEDTTDNFETTIEEQKVEDILDPFHVIEKLEVIESSASQANTDRGIFVGVDKLDDLLGPNKSQSTETEIHGYETAARATQNSISIEDIHSDQRDEADTVEVADIEKVGYVSEVIVDEPVFAQIHNSDPDTRDDVMLWKKENDGIDSDEISGNVALGDASILEAEMNGIEMETSEAKLVQGENTSELWKAFGNNMQENIPSYEKKTSSEEIERKDVSELQNLDDDDGESFQTVSSDGFENNLKQKIDVHPEATAVSEQDDFTFNEPTAFGLEGVVVSEATVFQSIDDFETYEKQNTREKNAGLKTKLNGNCTLGGVIFNRSEIFDVEKMEIREAKVTENRFDEDLQARLKILASDSDEPKDSGTEQHLAKAPCELPSFVDLNATSVSPGPSGCVRDVDLTTEGKSTFEEVSEDHEGELFDRKKAMASDLIDASTPRKEDFEFSKQISDGTRVYTDATEEHEYDNGDDNDDAVGTKADHIDDDDNDDLKLSLTPGPEINTQTHSKALELDKDSKVLQGDINVYEVGDDVGVTMVSGTPEEGQEPFEYEAEKISRSQSNDVGSLINEKTEEEVDEARNNFAEVDIITDISATFNDSNSPDVGILIKNESTVDENLELTDFQLCRESSFVNEVIVKELSNENADDAEGGLKERNTGDLREEYRARADMQHLPNELLDNLPLALSPRSSINAVTMIPSVLLGQNDEDDDVSDTESERSCHGHASSDSDDEIEFGPAHLKNHKALDKSHISLQGEKINTQVLEPDTRGKDALNELITEKEGNSSLNEELCETEGFFDELNEQGAGIEPCGTKNPTFENEWYDNIQKEKEFVPSVKNNSGNELNDVLFDDFDGDLSALPDKVDDEINVNNKTSATCRHNLTEDPIVVKSSEELNAVNDIVDGFSEFAAKTETTVPRKDSDVEALKEFEELEDLFGIGDLSDAESEVISDRPPDFDPTNKPNTMDICGGGTSRNEIVSFSNISDATEDFLDAESDIWSDKPSDLGSTSKSDTMHVGSHGANRKLDDFRKQDEILNVTADHVKDDILTSNAKDRTGELNAILDKDTLNPVSSQDQGNKDVANSSEDQRKVIARLDTAERKELDEFENLEIMLGSEDNLNLQEENSVSQHEIEGLDDSFELEMTHHRLSIQIQDDPNAETFQDEEIYQTGPLEAENEPEKSFSLKDELEAAFSGRIPPQVSESSNVIDDKGTTESASTVYEEFSASSETTFESVDEGLDKATRADLESTSTHHSMNHSRYGTPVVIDNGSGRTKAGFATQNCPSVVIPAIIGRPNYEQVMGDPSGKDFYVGTEAERYRGVLKLSYPIEHGIVTNWDDMEKLWDHVFLEELRIDASEHPVLLTEAPFNPRKNRERMIEIMMESYQVPAFYVAIQAVLSLYAAGVTTGVVLDCGDGVTHVVPVYDGCSLPHATERLDIAGRDLTNYLMRILMERGYSFNTTAEREICRDIKEQLCFVAEDFNSSMDKFEKSSEALQNYTLPDGQVISMGNEQFRCAEILFQPNLIGRDVPGIHEYLYKSIQRCNVDLRSELYSNIVLSGGTTMLKGLDIRLRSELSHLVTTKMADDITDNIKVRSIPEREFLVWCGGAALTSMKSFENAWISSDEYFECGVDIVHRKCF